MIGEPIDDGNLKKISVDAQMRLFGTHTSCYSQSGHKIVDHSPDNGLGLDWSGEEAINTKNRHANDNNDM